MGDENNLRIFGNSIMVGFQNYGPFWGVTPKNGGPWISQPTTWFRGSGFATCGSFFRRYGKCSLSLLCHYGRCCLLQEDYVCPVIGISHWGASMSGGGVCQSPRHFGVQDSNASQISAVRPHYFSRPAVEVLVCLQILYVLVYMVATYPS